MKPSEYLLEYTNATVVVMRKGLNSEDLGTFRDQLNKFMQDDKGADWIFLRPDDSEIFDEKTCKRLEGVFTAYREAQYMEAITDLYEGAKKGVKLIRGMLEV